MGDSLRFTVYFDGTGNNKDLNKPEGTQTNVARLFELDTAKGDVAPKLELDMGLSQAMRR